jgi:SAM-dependent methyltransferase
MLTKITDEAGLKTLEIFADTDRFNSWLFKTLTPYCTNNLLEIGSGIGNISKFLLQHFSEVTLSDMRAEYREVLEKNFGDNPNLKKIQVIDLSEKRFEETYQSLQNGFSTIIASNVVEHIEDDHLAIKNCKSMLKKNGRLIVLVPAYQWLYNSFDQSLGHYRRYNKTALCKLFSDEGFNIIHSSYFNFCGIFGWWFSATVLNKKNMPKDLVNIYDKFIPLIKLADALVLHKAGLSVIVAGEKK